MKAGLLRPLLLASTLALAACGSDVHDGVGTGIPPAPSVATSYGAITRLGSVVVNGVEFNTVGASIVLDDGNVTQSALRIGMVVKVTGSISATAGTATQIHVDDALKGHVEAVADAGHMTVMGQTVLVDDLTRFDGTVPAAGDFVSVHGQAKADGIIAASYVEKNALALPSPLPYLAKGYVKGHTAGVNSFQIGNLTVNFSNTTTLDSALPTGSWNGLLVEVKGTGCTGSPVCGTLTASKIELGGLRLADAPQAEVEGFVTQFISASDFKLGVLKAKTAASTVYLGGTIADLAVGVRIEVEGTIAGSILSATKISFRDSVFLEADVASTSLAAGSLSLVTLAVPPVNVDGLTEFKAGVTGLAGLAPGDHIRVRGRARSASVLATLIEKRSASTQVVLQGPVDSVATSPEVVTILTVPVNVSAFPDSQFKNAQGDTIGRTEFFRAVARDKLVKAKGVASGATVTWTDIELEE